MEVHMSVSAGAEPMNEGDCANVQGRLFQLRRPRASGMLAMLNEPQKNAQHHVEHWPVVLDEVTQPLWHRYHPLAQRQAREYMIRQVRRRLHHAPCVARGA